MMIYLFIFRIVDKFGLPAPSGHTNMLQMIFTLKIIGFAFEKSDVQRKCKEGSELKRSDEEIRDSTIMDIAHYCFNYIGILTGPYVTYKSFYDYFHTPYQKHVDCWKATFERLKFVPLYAVLFLVAEQIWPLEYAMTDEFYQSRSFLYRLAFVWPTFFIFRMRIYSGIILAECVCISAGFGAYPKELESKCGHGPSKEVTPEILEKLDTCEYDFETVKNINVSGVERCLTFREAMKHWNRCIQFWLAIYVYKRFPNKKYRIVATMLVSAFWHGVYAGYYFCILGPIVYLPLEDIYLKLFKSANDEIQKVLNGVIWTLKFFAFSYMGTAFLLKEVKIIWFYYSSVYHFAYIFWAVLYVVCFLLLKQKKADKKKSASEEAKEAENVEAKKDK
jgi:lysophospholipid acyltransferase 7